METKRALREKFLKIRNEIPAKAQEASANAIANHVEKLLSQFADKHIACYLGKGNEVKSDLLIEKVWAAKRRAYLPCIAEEPSKLLTFYRYEFGTALKSNRYGIFEPKNHTHSIKLYELDMVLLPLVAFDMQGNRLGMGGGFYDATFAFANENSGSRQPKFIGIAYACQQTVAIPHDSWDVRLDGVVTENGFIQFPKS